MPSIVIPPRLQKIYDSLPAISCKGKCFQSCGPIPLMPIEALILLPVTPPESVPVQPAGGGAVMARPGDSICPHLTAKNRCGIYQQRPAICRMYGLIKQQRMRCPHGCKPSRWLSKEESHAVLKQIEDLTLSPQFHRL